jgi:hypothetical protein
MPHIFGSKLYETAHHYFDRDQSLNEPVYRAPGAVGPLTLVYHAPFIVQSQEDEIFNEVRTDLAGDLVKKGIIGRGGQLSIFKAEDFDGKPFFDERAPTAKGFDHGFDAARKYLRDNIAARLDDEIVEICRCWPEYFIFCSISQIIQQLHYRAAALLVQRETEKSLGPPNSAATGRDIGFALKRLVQRYHREFDLHSDILRDVIHKRTLQFTGKNRFKRNDPPDHGGIIAILRQRAEQNLAIEGSNEDLTFESDFLSLRFPRKPWHQSFFRLRWYRSNQFWAYTFFETFRDPPPEKQEDQSIFATSRHLTLGEQETAMLALNYNNCIAKYLIVLLDFLLTPSEHSELESEQRRRELGLDYPGKLLAGAHYAFVPVGLLIALVVCPKWCSGQLMQIHSLAGLSPHVQALNRLASSNIVTLPEYRELCSLLEEMGSGKFASTLRALAEADSCGPQEPLSIVDLLQLGSKIYAWIRREKDRADRWGRVITRLAIVFWTSIGHDKERIGQSAILSRNYHDFISCYVVDRRAVYFTNFLPLPDDRFTRTLFVELALNGFQRGRLTERLSDIATFRSLCVRDNNRVRAMIRSTDEISHALNDLVIEEEKPLERARSMMESLDDIQERLNQMNLFVTYGVRGRHLSVRAYFERIIAIDRDIRQSRITGFPMLADFLGRRISRSVNDIARMSELHNDLRRRIQDEYNRCRTKFNMIETLQVERSNTTTRRLTAVLVTLTMFMVLDVIFRFWLDIVPRLTKLF